MFLLRNVIESIVTDITRCLRFMIHYIQLFIVLTIYLHVWTGGIPTIPIYMTFKDSFCNL